MNSIICSAIRSHNVIRFYCDGGYRTAEPFCHGASRAGNDLLRAYQIGGYSDSDDPVKWRLSRVDKMSSTPISCCALNQMIQYGSTTHKMLNVN